MIEFQQLLGSLARPSSLVRAADSYSRMARPMTAEPRALLSKEARLEASRRGGGDAYSAARHVEVLGTIIALARLGARTVAN